MTTFTCNQTVISGANCEATVLSVENGNLKISAHCHSRTLDEREVFEVILSSGQLVKTLVDLAFESERMKRFLM